MLNDYLRKQLFGDKTTDEVIAQSQRTITKLSVRKPSRTRAGPCAPLSMEQALAVFLKHVSAPIYELEDSTNSVVAATIEVTKDGKTLKYAYLNGKFSPISA